MTQIDSLPRRENLPQNEEFHLIKTRTIRNSQKINEKKKRAIQDIYEPMKKKKLTVHPEKMGQMGA